MITKKDIGQRVVVNGNVGDEQFCNEKGIIISVDNGRPPVGVRFDRKKKEWHDCEGSTDHNQGFYVNEENITFEEEKMTGIRIETEKIVDGYGKICRKITGFKALPEKKLPAMYLKGERPVCFINNNKHLALANRAEDFTDSYFTIDEIVPEKNFQKLIEHCHKAGDHLKDVNQELARKKAEWNGIETFVI